MCIGREVRHHVSRKSREIHQALKDAGIVIYHEVPTVEAAIKCVESGIDGFVVEGTEGGGFKNLEEVSTLVLLQAIRAKVDVPIIESLAR